ncbi:MAG: hypothetical protein KC800_24250, partial [Candidatus Eremiobacteraeota bacterium]|nr:hypothetical protein [Candidatus Eremiobacteraeota bacterium]
YAMAAFQGLWAAGDSMELSGPDRVLGSRAHFGPLPFDGPGPAQGEAPPLKEVKAWLVELSLKPLFFTGVQRFPDGALQLVGRALLQEAASEPRTDDELDGFRTVFSLADSVRQGMTVDNEVSSLSLDNDAFEALAYRCSPSRPLAAEDWKKLSAMVLDSNPNPQRLSLALAGSHRQVPVKLDAVLTDPSFSELVRWLKLPGWRAREQRFVDNSLAEALHVWEKGGLPDAPTSVTDDLGVGSLLIGESGLLTSTLTPPFWVAAGKTASVRARLTGLGLSYALLAYQAENGSFPGQLSDLRTMELPLPARDELQSMEVVYENKDGNVTLNLKYPPGAYTLEEFTLPLSWVQVTDDRLLFRLAP